MHRDIVKLQAVRSPRCNVMRRTALGALLLPACALILGITADSFAAEPDAASLEFFEKSVRPVLLKHCYECHAAGKASGGLALDTREGVLKGGESGAAVVPGNPKKSRLIEAIGYRNPDLQMPPQNRLSATEVAALEKWVALGAPDPRHGGVDAVPASTPPGMSIEEGRNFWSFRPVANPAIPKVRRSAWIRTPIDAFVLAKLEAAGLEPAPPADKRTLVRRATFDLTGLPPTPAEIDAFLRDESPQAFERVVERLLKSPEYGVRWGRHWLDVARYADSNGLDENLAFGNAWRYRDYVVDAFNQDKPFDRFLIEQLAGDLLPEADQETKTATGLLVLGAKVLAEPDREKLEMDTIDEQLDTIGKVFFGMSLGCVRCHDHKFDPLKQTDYYALAAVFKSTRTFGETNTGAIKHWHEYSFASDAERDELKLVDAAIAAKKKAASAFKSTAIDQLRSEARARATDYLTAAAGFDAGMSLTQVEAIAKPLGLHPHILHHCRLHLEYQRDDAFFGRWHEFVAAGDLGGMDKHYRTLFVEAEAAWAAAKKGDPKAIKLADPRLELARQALSDPSGLLAVPDKPEDALTATALAEYHRLAEDTRVLESGAPDAPGAMGVADGKILNTLPIHIRGSHHNLGKPVSRSFPEVMCDANVVPTLPADQSGRLELARWMVDAQHPLTARVYVNRVWRWHFGTGIVASTENFGKLGDRPSHPELLDWLARRFTDSGWTTKDLHRWIMNSSVYQSASTHPQAPACEAADPEDRLLWKFPLRRLEAEEIRDAALAVTGRLDRVRGGKTIPLRNRQFVFDHTSIDHTKYDGLRRTIYLPVVRNNLYTLFEQFDFPDPTTPTGNRNSTVVAPQALLMLNSELIMDSAEVWARRLLELPGDDGRRIRTAYETAYGRPPTDAEARRAREFVTELLGTEVVASSNSEQTPPNKEDVVAARHRAWAIFCQSLLASNEFIYVR